MTQGILAMTGATGFVGATLVDLAIAAGWRVRALTRRPQPARPGMDWVAGALNAPESLAALAMGSDAMIHVAGVVNAADAAGFEAGNVVGTLNMVQAARESGVRRFIHVSSLSAREPALSAYGHSKAKAETIVQASGLDWTIIRPPGIYGPRDHELLDVFKMARLGFVVMPPRGRASWIEVSDLGRLLLAVIPADEAIAQTYEPDDGAADGWSHESFAKAVGWGVGRRVAAFHAPRWALQLASRGDRLVRKDSAKLTPDRVSYMCHANWCIDPAKRPPFSLWQPQISTRAGLKVTANAYRQAGLLR